MPTLNTVELSVQERGILATAASATLVDELSKSERRPISGRYEPQIPIVRTREYSSRGEQYSVRWQDHGGPLPDWFDPLIKGFVDLRTLPPNWDSYSAGQIDSNLIDAALNFVVTLMGPSTPPPRVIPLSSGGLQVEWHRGEIDIEVVFERNDSPFFYYRNRAAGEEFERDLPESRTLLFNIVNKLD